MKLRYRTVIDLGDNENLITILQKEKSKMTVRIFDYYLMKQEGDVSKIARKLKMDRSNLLRRIRDCGIKTDDYRPLHKRRNNNE